MTYESLENPKLQKAKRIEMAADSMFTAEFDFKALFKDLGVNHWIRKGITEKKSKNSIDYKFSRLYYEFLDINALDGICDILAYATYFLVGKEGTSSYDESENKCKIKLSD